MPTRATSKPVYVTHPMGVACPDCRQSAHEGKPLRHSGRCDLLPKRSEVAHVGAPVGGGPTAGDSPKADARNARLEASRRRLLDGVATEQDLREAASGSLRGLVSDSDAMNQDT